MLLCVLAAQTNATLKAKVDILRSNLADVRGRAERSEELEAQVKTLTQQLQQAGAAASGLTESGGADGKCAGGADEGEEVSELRRRLADAEAQLAAAAEEAEEAQSWQADETAELQGKLKKAETKLAAATSDAQVGFCSRALFASAEHASLAMLM